LQRVFLPIQGATKLSLQTHKRNTNVVNTTDITTITDDFDLCCSNARRSGEYMDEVATVWSFGKGKAKCYFFRLEDDPREVLEYFKKEMVINQNLD